MMEYHLDNWSVASMGNGFQAPEIATKCLAGTRLEDNRKIITSSIMSIEGHAVTTYSGNVYHLGTIDPVYVAWMKDNNVAFDPEHPIKIKQR